MPRLRSKPPRQAPRAALGILTATLLSLLGSSSLAAPAAPELESITVTANRSSQSLNSVTASIAELSHEDLRQIGAVHISESLSRLPGTWISRGNGQEHLTAIRSPVFTGAGSCGAFYFAEDGLPIRPAGVCNVNELAEINSEQAERIEVLRGPGTAVHGSNAQHGVINVISAAPPQQQESTVAVEAGANQYLRLLATRGDRAPGNAYRLSLNAAQDGGYKDHSGFNQQKLSYRHDLDWSALSLQSLLSIARLDQQTAGFIFGKNSYRRSELKKQNPNPEAFRENRSVRWYGKFSLELDEDNTFTVTPYVRYQEMRFLQHFLLGQPLEENGLYSGGWQSNWQHRFTPGLSLNSGIDGEWSNSFLKETQDAPVPGIGSLPAGKHYDYQVDGLNLAAFAQLDWEIGPATRLNAGVRAERQAYDYDNRMLDGATRDDGTPCGASPCRYSRPADRSDEFGEASFNAGLMHELGDNHSMVLNAAHGFRPPQAAELYRLQSGQLTTDIDSEQIDSVELGWRATWRRFSSQLTAFHMEKSDVIFQDSQRRNVSGARTEHDGVEYSFSWNIDDAWTLSGDGSWARHRYASADALQGLPAGTNIDGNDIDTAPRVTASTRINWQPDSRTSLELEWQHMGRYYLEPTESQDYPGHDLLYLRLLRQQSSQFNWAVRIKNLTNEDYAERADYAFGDYRYFVGEPRSLFVEFGWTL